MRIAERIQISGQFWLPATPGKKIPGTLSIEDGGSVDLEVVGLFEEWRDAWNSPMVIPRIQGEVEEYGSVTLENCFYRNRTISFGQLRRNRVKARFAFFNVAYGEKDSIAFTSYDLSIEGLDEWHALTGIKTKYQPQPRTAEITYTELEPVDFWSAADVRVSIRFSWKLSRPAGLKEATISQRSFLRIEFEKPATIEEFSNLAHKLVQFFTLGIGEVVSLHDVVAKKKEPNDKSGEEVLVPIYFESLSFSEKPSKIDIHDLLFTFSDLEGKHQEALNRWIHLHEKIGAAMNLYFSAVGDPHKYLNVRFLWVAQALETYHRRTSTESQMPEAEFEQLKRTVVDATPEAYQEFVEGKLAFANEPNLATRIKRMLGRFEKYFGTPDDKERLTRAIVNTRNYYTHYSPSLAKKAARGRDLWELCQQMEALFQLLMMSDMGFSDSTIDTIANRNGRLDVAVKSNGRTPI